MPDFPRYRSQGQLTTQQPSFLAAEDTGAEITAEIGKVGTAVQEAANVWLKATDVAQKTTARANAKDGILDILNREQNDPDVNNADKYYKELEKLRTESLKGISSKRNERETALEIGLDIKQAEIQIQQSYKKKMIDVGQASTIRLLDSSANNPAPGFENSIRKELDAQVKAGIFDSTAALKLEQQYVRKGKFNLFLSDLRNDPSFADENLNKNAYDFDVKELRDARGIYDAEINKIKSANEADVLKGYLVGEDMNPASIEQLLSQGKIDANFAKSMIDLLKNPKPDVTSQDRAYIDFQGRAMELDVQGNKATLQDSLQLISDTMQAHRSGLLDKGDVQKILKTRMEFIDEQLKPSVERTLEAGQPWYVTAYKRLSFWADEYADERPEVKARMYRKLMDAMAQEKNGEQALADIVDEEISIKLEDDLKKPDRQYAKDGERRIYSDDGEATWYDDKTGKEVK